MPNEANTGTRAYVPGKQVTVAHLIAHPAPEVCEKAGIPDVDAIGILTLTPGETAIIAGDMAVRSADVNVAFLDRFSGTLILYGSVGAVEQALTQVNDMLNRLLQFTICPVTRPCRRAALGPPPFRSGFGRGGASRAIRCVPPAFRGGGRHAAFNPEAGGIAYLRARRAEAAGAAGGRPYADAEGERPLRRKSCPNAGNACLPGRPRPGRARSAPRFWSPVPKGGSSRRNRPYSIKI